MKHTSTIINKCTTHCIIASETSSLPDLICKIWNDYQIKIGMPVICLIFWHFHVDLTTNQLNKAAFIVRNITCEDMLQH